MIPVNSAGKSVTSRALPFQKTRKAICNIKYVKAFWRGFFFCFIFVSAGMKYYEQKFHFDILGIICRQKVKINLTCAFLLLSCYRITRTVRGRAAIKKDSKTIPFLPTGTTLSAVRFFASETKGNARPEVRETDLTFAFIVSISRSRVQPPRPRRLQQRKSTR